MIKMLVKKSVVMAIVALALLQSGADTTGKYTLKFKVDSNGDALALKLECDRDKVYNLPVCTSECRKFVGWVGSNGKRCDGDLLAFNVANAGETVTMTAIWENGSSRYMVIDLSGGTTETKYRVSYLDGIPAGGWTDDYKTSKLVLRWIEPGTFTMGSPTDELGRKSKETKHQVTLTRGCWMAVFETTQRQWELVMGEKPSYFDDSSCYESRPVEKVSYDMIRGSSTGAGWPANSDVDAESFLGKLRAKTGGMFDLPTEAQWEYACRAGTTTALNSGKNLTKASYCPNMDDVGRYNNNGGSSDGTAKVGSYAPNAWGLYDMHGNVSEWCLDWGLTDLGDSAVSDPSGEASGSNRILRGGNWNSDAELCRSAFRGSASPATIAIYSGFRLCCFAAPPRYMVVDLSGGTAAKSYPVSYLNGMPAGGWTDEYKQSKLVLRWIEPGALMMGSPEDELGRFSDETQHLVSLTNGYWMAVFETTQRQWELVMGTKPSYFNKISCYMMRPVEQISYDMIRGSSAGAGWPANPNVDVDSFLGKLRAKTGGAFDLPTEAQWEYACRAGTTMALNSGKNLTDEHACANMAEVGRYSGNSGSSS